MKSHLNLSSDEPRLTFPNSCIMNSLMLDENSMNSFTSQRAGSVTVSGKKLHSQDTLFTCKESRSKKFPIPIQTLSRISKQNTQVKKFLYKKSTKSSNNQPASPKIKSKHMKHEEVSEKPREESALRVNMPQTCFAAEESPRGCGHLDTPGIKTHEKAKNTSKKGGKSKPNLAVDKKIKKEVKHQLKLDIEKINFKSKSSKALAYEEKLVTPRSCKNKSKKAIAVKKNQKITKEFHEEGSTNEKKNNSQVKKKPVEFSKVLKALGNENSKIKAIPNYSDSADHIFNKRNSDSIPRLFAREMKRKHTQKKLKRIENIFLDNKSKISLESIRKVKSKDDLLHRNHKLRVIPQKLSLNKLKRYEDREKLDKEMHSSRTKFLDPNDQDKKCEISQKKKIISKQNTAVTEDSAIMIQSHIRKYLAQKKYKRNKESFSLEDAEVKSIISVWKKDTSTSKNKESSIDLNETPAKTAATDTQMSSLNKLKVDEINEIRNIIEHCDENSSILDTITKIIDSRYRNIEKIIKTKYELEESQLSMISKENKILKDSPLKNWRGIDENDINTKSNSETPNKLESENSIKEANSLQERIHDGLVHEIISNIPPELKESSTSNLIEIPEECIEKPDRIAEQRKNQKLLHSDISSLSEIVLKYLLAEELEKYYKEHRSLRIEEPIVQEKFDLIIDFALNFIARHFNKIFLSIKKPLRKNPLEILAKMQRPYIVNPLRWDCSQFPLVITPNHLNEFILSMEASNSQYLNSQIKMLIDSCNQVLQSFRPYGIAGVPMPWAFSSNGLSLKRYKSREAYENFKQRIHWMNSICAGKIPDNSYITSLQLDEEKLQNNREEKIGILIAHDIRSNEETWIDYGLEEMQTKLNAADAIFQDLIGEVVNILQF